MVKLLELVVLMSLVATTVVVGHPRLHRRVRQADADENQNRLEHEPEKSDEVEDNPLGLPSKASSIRSNIVDTFSCQEKPYGYYADVDNECQIFHVCLPVIFPDTSEKIYKWSFICPAETIFNQETFTCSRAEDAIPCADAPSFYIKNDEFGKIPEQRAGAPEVAKF